MNTIPPPIPQRHQGGNNVATGQQPAPVTRPSKKSASCLSMLTRGCSLLFIIGIIFVITLLCFYKKLEKAGVISGVKNLSGFVSDMSKQEREDALMEKERRAKLTPEERAREDSFELEKQKIAMERERIILAERPNITTPESPAPTIDDALKTAATIMEIQRREDERRAKLTSEERLREDEMKEKLRQDALKSLDSIGNFVSQQVKQEHEDKQSEMERRAKLTPEERAREDEVELEKRKIELEKDKIKLGSQNLAVLQ